MPPLAIAGISAGASVLGSVLSSRKKTTTSTTMPTYSPQDQELKDRLTAYSQGLLADPSAGTQPIKLAAMEKVNKRYASAPGQIAQQLSKYGYGSSGKFGGEQYGIQKSRLSDLSDLEGQFADIILRRQNEGASLGERLLSAGRGSTSTGTQPGDMAGAGLQSGGNALESVSTLLALSKLLKG